MIKINSQNEKDIILQYSNGKSTKEISNMFNVTTRTISYYLKKNTITIRSTVALTKDQQANVVNLYNSGKNIKQISKDYNVSEPTISSYLQKNNVIIRKIGFELVKFTTVEQQQIGELYLNNYSIRSIAKMFTTSPQSILTSLKLQNINRRELRKYTLDEKFFDIINTSEKSYVLGILYADGSNTSKEINLKLIENDKLLLDQINMLFNSNRPLCFTNRNKQNLNHKNVYTLSLSSVYMCKIASEKWGLYKNKTFKIKFPTNLESQFYSHFIRGYFDGDGCIYFNKKTRNLTWTIVGTNALCEYIKTYLKTTLNINSHIHQHKHVSKKIKTLYVGGNKQVIKLMDFLYINATIWMNRKRQKYIESIEYIKQNSKKDNSKKTQFQLDHKYHQHY